MYINFTATYGVVSFITSASSAVSIAKQQTQDWSNSRHPRVKRHSWSNMNLIQCASHASEYPYIAWSILAPDLCVTVFAG